MLMLGNDSNDAKKIWRTVKTVSGEGKRTLINKIIVNGIAVTKQCDIANGLNDEFINKIKIIKDKMPKPQTDLLGTLKKIPSPL